MSKISFVVMLLLCARGAVYSNITEKDSGAERNVNQEQKKLQKKDTDADSIPSVVIVGTAPLTSSSDQTIRNSDFMNFPKNTTSDLMRMVPGLYITQHTGGAKAHQVFLRGFDAEHGQDIAAFIDGIPINEPSHVHGQGYLDLHFIITESIEKMWTIKGPYDPRYGNFATAGVINFIPYKKRDYTCSVEANAGSHKTFAGIGELYHNWQEGHTYWVVEGDRTDGYTDPGKLHAGRMFFQHQQPFSGGAEFRMLYAGYYARSQAADIMPIEYINNTDRSRFEALDDSNRVDVDRHLLGLTYENNKGRTQYKLQSYYNYKRTEIFSNYTFYYYDPARGDQLEQSDERHYFGIQGHVRKTKRYSGINFNTEIGFSQRTDFVSQTQAHTENRERYNQINHYRFAETAFGVYLDERIEPAKWLQFILGCRYDLIWYKGDGEQDRQAFDIYTNSAIVNQDVETKIDTYAYALSPKASLVAMPLKQLSFFLNFGRGFVSTQARQIAWEQDRTMPVITSAELGTRAKLLHNKINVAVSGWIAEKEAEFVFDSEYGASVSRGRSRRTGVDAELRVLPAPWLYIGTDINYVKAVFVESNEPIPNMANWLMTNIISVIHPSGLKGSVRGRYLGKRAHDLRYESDPYYIVDILAGYSYGPVTVTLSVENLFATAWYDSVFAYTSRPEQNGETIEGLHATPGTPRTIKLKVKCVF